MYPKSRLAISQFKSAAHYSETKSRHATIHYVYTVEVPDLTDDNHIDFNNPVHPAIDHENFIEAKNIILLNAFLKKSNKDYRKQIEIAENILNRLEL